MLVIVAAAIAWPATITTRTFAAAADDSPAAVLPDSSGAIREITLQYCPDMNDEVEPVFWDLLAKTPPDIRVVVLCPTEDAADEFVDTWGGIARLGGREVLVVNTGRDISVWARDRRFARCNPATFRPAPSFVPTPFADYQDWQRNELDLAGLLDAAGLGHGIATGPLHVEGGNVVSSAKHVFLGANALSENADDGGPLQVKLDIRRLLGRPPIFVGTSCGQVPWCHIDMYLTPFDNRTVLVASPSLGDEIMARVADSDDQSPAARAVLDSATDTDFLDAEYSEIVEKLSRLGFTLYRLPTVASPEGGWMLTYNNVLIDERDGRKIVYMPNYGIPAMDDVAAAIYTRLGAEVRTIDVSRLFVWGGAVRCVANVTERSPVGHEPSPRRRSLTGVIKRFDLSDNALMDGPFESPVDTTLWLGRNVGGPPGASRRQAVR